MNKHGIEAEIRFFEEQIETFKEKLQEKKNQLKFFEDDPCPFVELPEKNQDKHAAMSSKGGKASKRKITPEQQAKMQAARKLAKAKKS